MATLGLALPVINAIRSKLQAGYAARVAVINGESWGVTIQAPDATDYYRFGVNETPRYPAIVITQRPSDDESEAEGPHSFIRVADYLVVVYDTDTDRETLGVKLALHARAISEVLWDDDPKEALTNVAFHLKLVRDDPGPVADPDAENVNWRGAWIVTARCHSTEGPT